MDMAVYAVLLRGINVGGNNIIKMDDLKKTCERMGFMNVKTYIQSGNIVFSSSGLDTEALTRTIEKTLSSSYGYDSKVVVIDRDEYARIIDGRPKGFGDENTKYRYDVWFLKGPLSAEEVMEQIETREGVDSIHAGDRVVYTTRLQAAAGKSYFPKVVQLPIYKHITVRNWNTVQKVYALMSV